uniref:Multidrug resistance protein, MATE family n=1 Tax=Candidatus Kentrum sp. MB TaxID=2138164 RepID=A0A450Y1Z7_9GAMM|nr:MAG: multidrug resistance protein, MATE family [Candidatus Kentron sp. MB]VFK35535.1 MAG: multidrug resistance protein, MATE family [Candidatus Kentron sp. MB]VFK77337.1 MAG: multidrug resistance protein, MATE family [Candidatus Kentron sp. MB]
MTSKSSESQFPTLSDLRATLNTTLPLTVGYVGWMLICLTDSIMLGRLGPEALSAAGLALAIYNIIAMLGWGLLFPVIVFVSRICGAERPRRRIALLVIRQGLWISGILSIPGCIILWNTTHILMLAGQDPILAGMAGQYMDYHLWTLFPVFTTFAFTMAFTAMDRTRTIALIIWLEVGLNILLNYALIFGNLGFPAMGLAGAGLASIVVYGAGHMAFFMLLGFHRFFRSFVAFKRAWKPSRDILGRSISLGWPKSLDASIITIPFSIFALLAGWFGVQTVTAYTIAWQIALMISHTLSSAAADTVTVGVSAALARKSHVRMYRALYSSILTLLILLSPLIGIFWAFPEWIVTLFLGSEVPNAREFVPLVSSLIMLVGFFLIADGFRVVCGQALNGLSDMKIPALIAALAYWGGGISFGVLLGFAMDFGVQGFWIGLTLGMSFTTVCYLIRFRWLVREFYRKSSGVDPHPINP